MPRVYLSPPHLSGRELDYLRDAIDSNWVAPLGPHVDAFEAEIVGADRRAARARALERDRRAPPRARRPRDRPRRRGRLFLADLLGEREPDSLRRGDTGLHRRERGDLDARPRVAPAGAGRAAADQGRRRRRPLRAVLRLRRDPRALRRARRGPRPGRGRVARRDVSRGARRRSGRPRGLLLQRQQGDHDERRRDARLPERRVDRTRAQALDAGARARAALRAHRGRLQLPPQQPAGRRRPGAARSAPGPRRGHGAGSTPATASCCPTSSSCPRPTTGRATAG